MTISSTKRRVRACRSSSCGESEKSISLVSEWQTLVVAADTLDGAPLRNALGIAWVHEGRFDEAIAEFATATSLSNDPDIAENLARARRGIGPS